MPPEVQAIFLPPSPPPAEKKATACQDQAGQASIGGGAGDRCGANSHLIDGDALGVILVGLGVAVVD